jgi:hypothetical protein
MDSDRQVTVKHGFWHDQTYYTAGNAQDVLNLPAEVQQAQLESGAIELRDKDGVVITSVSGREV